MATYQVGCRDAYVNVVHSVARLVVVVEVVMDVLVGAFPATEITSLVDIDKATAVYKSALPFESVY